MNDLVAITPTPASRLDVFRELTANLPLNDYGLPKFVYRADAIPEDFFDHSTEDQYHIQSTAAIDLFYSEGFPTFDDGSAFWSQMPHEPPDAFEYFIHYLGLAPSYGVRRLEDLVADGSLKQIGKGRHNFNSLVEFHTYYMWLPRSKAFDLFQQVAQAKLREQRILQSTNAHFLKAEELMTKVYQYFEQRDDEGELVWMQDMTPKTAFDAIDKLVKIQRISLGLPASGSHKEDMEDTPRGASIDMLMRNFHRKGADAVNINGNRDTMDVLLGDDESAEMAQKLIIRMNEVDKG